MIGKTILHYKIIEKLGEGGMGKVFLAEDTELDRKAALKFLPEHLTTDPEIKARFKREAKATAALNHPNIITIYEVGEFEGKTYIAMEYVEGESLRERLSRQKLSLDKSIEIATEVCKGLSEAHQAGIVHRDIKPDNILLDSKGRVKIADFGLAKVKGVSRLTKAESTLGTVNYMSPEQTRGEDVDHRSDIFSFGAMLYEMITGRLPFQGDYEAAVTYSILHEEPEPVERYKANLPQGLQTVIDKTLAKTPDERYQHVDEIIVDFKSLQTQHKSGKQAASSTTTKPGRRNRIYLYGGFAAFLILLSLVVGRTYFFPKQSESIDSIAVLPLQNLSGDPEQDIFTAGMHEALITELSKISALRTISRTSVMRYKETMKSIPEIAKELDVDAVVEGSVLRSGDKVRITVQLIGTAPERHLWAQTFDRDLGDVLALHSEVARQIADEIQIKVTQDEEIRLTSNVPVNPETYENYLLGRHYLRLSQEWNLKTAVEYFEQAVEIDSTFALGYAGLALAYSELGGNYNIIAPEDTWPKVREYAAKALALNERLAEAHTALALVKRYFDWDWLGAEENFRRAMELNSNSLEVLSNYAFFLVSVGRRSEAVALWEKANKLDPNSRFHAILAVEYSGRVEEAIHLTLIESQAEPERITWHWFLATYYAQVGKYDDAIKHLKIQIPLMKGDEVDEVALLGNLYGRTGRRIQASQMLERLDELSSQGKYVSPALKAWVYSGLNDRDNAIFWLTKGYEARAHRMGLDIIWFKYVFEPIADDPRFKELLRKMNLEPW